MMSELIVPILQTPSGAAFAAATRRSESRLTRLVLVDDDHDFRDALSRQLTEEACIVTAFSSGRAALDYLQWSGAADVCLLDWRMPVMSGIEVLREMRRRDIAIPVIFLTGLRDDACEEEALRDGAVDFINKSRRLSVLVKRIALIIEGRRPMGRKPEEAASDETQLRRGPLELRLDTKQAAWHGRPVDLTPAEFRILHRLVSRPAMDVSFRELYDLVHGAEFHAGTGDDGYRANVRSFIKRIRMKFRAIDPDFDRIQSYARFGYHWSAT
jgi:two-component system, OmpR family, response regulator ChvI